MPSDRDFVVQPSTVSADELRQSFSEKAVEHMLKPHNLGEFPAADGVGRASIPCGDSMQICLRVCQDRILEARFMTDGCGPVIACGSMATDLVRGKTISDAMAMSEDDIIMGLEGLPDAETHCATLALTALKQALIDHLALRREPWKRTYRQNEPYEPGR